MSKTDKKILKYHIVTFGCQMNTADSEKIAGSLELKGHKKVKSINEADVVIINTCSVRQSAEDRVVGQVYNLVKLKTSSFAPPSPEWLRRPSKATEDKQNLRPKDLKTSRPKIILTGCMLRYPLPYLKNKLSGVDEFIKLKDLLHKQPATSSKSSVISSQLSVNNHSLVVIMEGCDNFCTYCVVPSARGKEISRPIEEIYCEVKELVKRGVKEVMLLGQNVNSYHKNIELRTKNLELRNKIQKLEKIYKNNFALLLALLNDIKGLEKIKFMTSNPQDLTDDIIKALKLPKIDRYLHLPVQSGDDEILKKMNRKITAKQYLALINKIRKEIPNIEIGTDIIVGFPGETKEQFINTVNLCKKAKFNLAYISKYSPRLNTPAYKLEDNITFEEKKRRRLVLDKLINKIYYE